MSELDDLQDKGKLIYKSHYYFMMDNKHIVTTLPGNTTINRFQTYINWFIESLRGGTIYEFTPLITHQPLLRLADVSKVKIQDPSIEVKEDTQTKSKAISLFLLKNLLIDVKQFKEIEESDIVSAELLLKFKKPSSMDKKDYQRVLGAYMKPISDTDNITFYPKNAKPISGNEILMMKPIEVEKLESGKISVPDLTQKMEEYLLELRSESNI